MQLDNGARRGFTATGKHRETRHLPRERFHGIGHGLGLQLLRPHAAHAPYRRGYLFPRSIAHHYHLIDILKRRPHRHIDHRSLTHHLLLRGHAHIDELEHHLWPRDLQAVMPLQIGNGVPILPLYLHRELRQSLATLCIYHPPRYRSHLGMGCAHGVEREGERYENR